MSRSLVTRALLGLATVWTGTVSLASEPAWWNNYDEAVREAERLDRPLLVHFYGPHCGPCRQMEATVLHQPETLNLLRTKIVGVMVNAGESNQDARRLVPRFEVHLLPTDVLFDPKTGQVLARSDGLQSLDRYLSTAHRAATQFERGRDVHIARAKKADPKPEPQRTRSEPDEPPADAHAVTLGDPQPIVGVDGFSPVRLVSKKEWVRGKAEFGWEFKGVTYYMATRAEYESFRAAPEDFAPRLLGCDPVVLWETDRAVAGKIQYGAFFDGDLYFFQSEDTRKRFKQNPPKYIRIQHVLNVTNIERATAVR